MRRSLLSSAGMGGLQMDSSVHYAVPCQLQLYRRGSQILGCLGCLGCRGCRCPPPPRGRFVPEGAAGLSPALMFGQAFAQWPVKPQRWHGPEVRCSRAARHAGSAQALGAARSLPRPLPLLLPRPRGCVARWCRMSASSKTASRPATQPPALSARSAELPAAVRDAPHSGDGFRLCHPSAGGGSVDSTRPWS